jgi:phage tail P2-like protein
MNSTLDLAPDSIRDDPQVQSICYALDQEMTAIYGCIPSILFMPNILTISQPLIDILMWQLHVDVWQGWGGPLTDDKKKRLILDSLNWHSKKGTKWAVEQMLNVVFQKAFVTEWYQYGGRPYFFKIVVQQAISDPVLLNILTQAINALKNERSWMEGYEVATTVPHHLWCSVAVCNYKNVTVPVATNPHY